MPALSDEVVPFMLWSHAAVCHAHTNNEPTTVTQENIAHTATTVADNEATTVTRGRLCRGKSILQDSHTTQACHFKREFKRHSKKSYLVPC